MTHSVSAPGDSVFAQRQRWRGSRCAAAERTRPPAPSSGSWSPTGARSRIRIFRACRELGIETVAVHSDADATHHVVRAADLAALHRARPRRRELPARGHASSRSRAELGADADPPGVRLPVRAGAVRRGGGDAAGIVFIGPAPATLAGLGDKLAARRTARDRGRAHPARHVRAHRAGGRRMPSELIAHTAARYRLSHCWSRRRGRRRPGHASGRRSGAPSVPRSAARRPRRSVRSARHRSTSSATSRAAGTSRSSCWVTRMGRSWPSGSATARPSDATRSWWRRRRHPGSPPTHATSAAWPRRPSGPGGRPAQRRHRGVPADTRRLTSTSSRSTRDSRWSTA